MEDILEYLAGADALPLADYIPSQSRSFRILRRDCAPSLRGLVSYAQEDDDLSWRLSLPGAMLTLPIAPMACTVPCGYQL
jgi:hypothetical protein